MSRTGLDDTLCKIFFATHIKLPVSEVTVGFTVKLLERVGTPMLSTHVASSTLYVLGSIVSLFFTHSIDGGGKPTAVHCNDTAFGLITSFTIGLMIIDGISKKRKYLITHCVFKFLLRQKTYHTLNSNNTACFIVPYQIADKTSVHSSVFEF